MCLVTFLLEVKTSLAFWWDVTIATAELRARYGFSNIRKAEDLESLPFALG
jgi:hypothetical protein